MSEQEPEFTGENGETPRTNAEWAQYRQEQKARRDAERERDAALRRLAFIEAGVDPAKDPRREYFMKGYEGPAEADAIRKAATDAGFLAGGGIPQSPQQEADLAAQAAIDAASAGAGLPSTVDAASRAALVETMEQQGRDGVSALMRQAGIPVVREY